ncbi:hypothetical protein HYS00_04245 [Candidatus Microgenomates bacterium]|nr:hypothetical protein [Candidatus Microgenomates bacterium]
MKVIVLNDLLASVPKSIEADKSYFPISSPLRSSENRLHSFFPGQYRSYDEGVSISLADCA